MTTTVNERDFWDTYKPVMLDDAHGYVWQYNELPSKPAWSDPLHHIWTIVESGGPTETLYAVPGYHVVNVVGYTVTDKKWTDEDIEAVWSSMTNCPTCGRDMDAGEPHTADCERGIEQDHQDGDHSGCDHPVARGQEDEDVPQVNPAIAIIKAHIPSLTDENEDEIDQLRYGMSGNGQMADYAELAIRTCSCGRRIDGFYEYVDHLITMLGGESHIGG